MTAGGRREFTIRRIVVAADSSLHGRAAIEAAAELAGRLHAEVSGLFVEDINLLNMAELALGREMNLISGLARVLDKQTVESELRAEAAEARRILAALTQRARVRSSFRVVRGQVAAEVIAAAGEGDLLILGVYSRGFGPRPHPGSTAIAAARGAPRSVLLLRPGAHFSGKSLVAYDGSDGSEMSLEAAARLAAVTGGSVTALLVAKEAPEADELQRRVEERLTRFGLAPKFLRVPSLDLDEICTMAHDAGADVLVLNADNPVLAGEAHDRLLELIGCPILLVR